VDESTRTLDVAVGGTGSANVSVRNSFLVLGDNVVGIVVQGLAACDGDGSVGETGW
jgi:hypothetical protein